MKTQQNEEILVRTETCKREFGRYDDPVSNKQILIYQVIDKIITSMIEQGVQASVNINYFDKWLNLYISGEYDMEFSENSQEVSCTFFGNIISKPNVYLMHSLEFAGGMPLGKSVITSLMSSLAELNAKELEEDSIDQAEYRMLVTVIWSQLKVIKAVSLYLNEEFNECEKSINFEYLELDSDQLKFLAILMKIDICLIKGRGWEAVSYINDLGGPDWEDNELMVLKSGIYWTIGMYLEEYSHGLVNLLHDDNDFPESEKFLLLHAMHLSPNLQQENKKRRHYLKMAEQYTAKDINRIILLIEKYNALGFWKDALRLLKALEAEKGEMQLLNFTKARVLITAEKPEEALVLLDNLLVDENKENVDILAVKGDCLLSCERDDEAVICLQRVLEIEPEHQEALIILGLHFYYTVENYRKALHYLIPADKLGRMYSDVYEVLADIYEDLGLIGKSREYRNKA